MCRHRNTLLALAVFLFATVLIFRRFFFSGLLPIPYNILVGWYFPYNLGEWPGYYPGITFKGGLFAADVFRQMIPWKQLSLELLRQGQLPLWNPYNFSGEPLWANPQVALFYPLTPLFLLFSSFDLAWSWYIILSPFLGLVCMYLFLRSLRRSNLAAILGAFAFAFSGHMLSWLEWGVVTHSAIWLPLLLYGLNQWLKQLHPRRGRGVVLVSALATATGGYPQEAAYALLLAAAYFVFLLARHPRPVRPLKQSFFLGLVFLLLFSPQLLPAARLFSNSALKGAASESLYLNTRLHPRHLLTFFSPDYFGNRITENYWADRFTAVDYTDANLFIGSVAAFFVLLAFFSRPLTRSERFFRRGALLALLFSLHSPLTWLVGQTRLPLLSTGVAAGILYLAAFCLAVTAAFGVDRQLKHLSPRRLLLPLAVYLLVLLSALALPPPFQRTALRNLTLPLAVVTLSTALLLARRRLTRASLAAIPLALVLLAVGEYAVYAQKILSFSPPRFSYPDHPLFRELRHRAGYNRVTGFWDSDIATSLHTALGLYSAEGYNPLHLKSYQELFAAAGPDSLPGNLTRSDADFPEITLENTRRLLDLTSTAFLTAKVTDPSQDWETEPLKYPPDRFQLAWQQGRFKIYRNLGSLPRASIYASYQTIPDSAARLRRLFDPEWDPRTSLLLAAPPPVPISPQASGSAKITSYQPNRVVLASDTSGGTGLLLLTDTYYPNWRAAIDGRPTPVFPANHTFRAIAVPEGTHQITFTITWP